ncbi:hypothetical protein FS749_000812 [Ceratobasidium sp. UAMH 11750]|nr:hypothetical protein FS749_000812 [Ceratobasidium sp. UAMH 11750]
MSSSAGAGPSKRRGQYSSRACIGCRRRRCKCDGVQPTCGTCASYGRECEWSSETDARRPVTKQLVESLRAKIQSLEAELEQLKQGGSPATPSNPTDPLPEGSSIPAEHPSASPTRSSKPRRSAQSFVEPDHLRDLSEDAIEVERPPPPASHFTATAMYRYIFLIDTVTPAREQSKDVQLSLVCDWSRYLPQLPDITLTRLEHDTLLHRCFKHGTSWLLGLVPELFLYDMLYSLTSEESGVMPGPRLRHYSPLLHCSIMAFATAFSDDPVIRAPATRGRFASWAKQWLDEEFKEPAMSLAQALALLADYHCGIGERDAGYMYMGMSFRAARVFILSDDRESDVNEGVMGLPQSISRDWHFWSAFSHDKVMSIEYQREYDMPIPHSRVNLPSVDAELDNQSWPLESPATPPGTTSPSKLTTLAFHESCKLMIITTHIIDVMHHRGSNTLEEQMIINAHLRLDTWFNNLPENLLVWARSTSPLPHVIVLHICYWWLLIVLHHPLSEPKDQSPERDPAHARITDLSIKMSDRAAHKIVQLLSMFDDQHGLRFFPRNMIEAIRTCGVALLREYSSAPSAANKKRSNAMAGIHTCINALHTISTTWPSAEARADHLQQRLREQAVPTSPIIQVDGPSGAMPGNASADPDSEDPADISKVFYQYMHEWGHMPAPQGHLPSELGSESSSFSQTEVEWEGA